MIFKEEPEDMAGVTPMILSFFSANSTIVWPNTSWYLGACGDLGTILIISPVSLLNIPGACHLVGSPSSEYLYPFPFTVMQCKIFGPGMCFKSSNTFANPSTSCPSTGPK